MPRESSFLSALFVLFALLSAMTAVGAYAFFSSDNPPHEQPIAFSHKSHAGEQKIACLYCHIYAERSSVAGVPSVQKCIGCHEMIDVESPENLVEVEKLLVYWEEKKPIPWLKVYNLPDFVYFSHRMHLNAEIDCKECHGKVVDMVKIKQVSSLSMGWCLKCHQKHEAPIDCNVCHK